jgi:hypothetical protein
MKFEFKCVDEDERGSEVVVKFEADRWSDAFPRFLGLMRASGFTIDEGVALYIPNGYHLDDFSDDHIVTDKDFSLENTFKECGECEDYCDCCDDTWADYESVDD